MLSIENPSPDPPCSCQFPQLNSSSDERASQKLSLTEVDLPNPPVDHHTPLSNFSIRDYVFTARDKDIKKNWPFSLKNLQLCLKHGVKDVLPPFQPLDSVRNQSLKRCTVEITPLEKQNSKDFAKEPSRPENHVVLDLSDDAQLNNKIAESCIDISSCRSGEDINFPSTATSVSQSEIESLPDNRQSSSLLQTETCKKISVAVKAAGPSGNNKTESTFRPLSKKCRLIVKFGGNSDRNSTEDIASNSTTVSETIMASKVCPVCKTFSSTSNTTLNAHIDQCLSVESTPKWTADSKLIRHRIKPRKTRLMVDIYMTAPPCTLEELDRRNGTNWATASSLPTQETEKTETTNEGKKQRVSQIHPEDVGDVGPVYIDANGTKLRILSKFSDQPSVSKVGKDVGARKPFKGDKGIKYILKKKKKWLAQKHHKYMKLAPQSKKIFSHKAHGSQISRGQEECKGESRSSEKEHVMSKQAKSSDSRTLRPWVCSKRRGFSKKITSQEDHQPVRCNWHLLSERNHVQKFTNQSENPVSSSGNNGRMKSFHKVLVSNKNEQSPGRKGVGNFSLEGKTSDNVESFSPSMRANSNQLDKSGTPVHSSCMPRPLNSTRNYASSLSKKTANTHEDTTDNADIYCVASTKSSRNAHAIVTKAMEFSSRNFKGLSSVTESVPGKINKCSAIKKSRACFMKKRDEGAVTWHSEVDQQYDLIHGDAENQVESEEIADEESHERSLALETRQARGLSCISQGEKALALRSSISATSCYDRDVQVNADSSVGIGDDLLQKVDYVGSGREQVHIYMDDIVVEPSSKTYDGRNSSSIIKSVDSEFYKLSNSSKVQSNSFRSFENYGGLLCRNEVPRGPTESDFVNDREIFSADEAGNDMVGQDADIGVELDSEAGQGSSFPDVDPIPIPGPPGSFLPSPRGMGSDDFQGNSSLTTSRVHSSPDQHDVVDGDSSDSPISAASTISNSTAGRSDFNYTEPSSSVEPCIIQEKIKSTGASVEPSVQSAGTVPQATGADVERTTFYGEYMKQDRIYIEKRFLNFKNDQPCCCQKKERFSQGVALNFQDSQLLRRLKMDSVTVPSSRKHMDFNSNLRPADLDVRPELASPSCCTNSGSEKVILPGIKPLAGPISYKDSPNSGVRFLGHADSDSASPSASNLILRLMGKNLMVVNKDEGTSVPLGGVQPCAQNNHQTSPFLTFSRVSPGNVQNQDCHPLHHMGCQGSVIFSENSHKVGRGFDGGLSNNFRSQSDSRLPVHVRLPAGMFQDQHTDCSFATSMECHEYKGDYNISSQHNRLKNRLNVSPTDNVEKVITPPDRHCQCTDSSTNPVKEIVIIDDVPATENVVFRDVAKYTEGGRGSQVITSGFSIPTAPNYNPNCVLPFSCYQSQEHPFVGESPIVWNTGFHGTPTKLSNSGPVSWGCTSEGSGVLQHSPFTSASSSPGHLRSAALHYSPGFS
ncbi:hypothetical protein P3X46_016983 [Hevea brasiliensis]|uniref:Uncharacterized protein n=1 Tax=Hevea brasiliensis TaxID=3981 RepID=A0ABQ9M328_HEVBR|nr:uncharacterized protein LOC110644814 [Hevea brasiliensis]XP_021653451.2 uncharacterized protein LOC110644814 [Hevea brasiliensis]XP_021653453.2 uncharacterized protein LOC110644814 [Hevea brasiliensis]XP_021653456.2 uncharacterized protein LOC110644814 [Hevea brasiliensis]KAJ9173891.1 hypothetical protein P3X46_016983 [Hevea brasiliensis]KAJ9173892.1 hypothetical protein P3X46_016983 [Hevea brasiliensis]